MMKSIDLSVLLDSLYPLVWIVGGWGVGWILEAFLVGRLRRFAEKTTWEGDDILIGAVDRLVRIAAMLLGAHVALGHWSLSTGLSTLLHKGLVIAGILVATVFLSRIATGFLRLYTRDVEGVVPSTSIFLSLTRVLVMVLGILIALQSVGISIAPILTAMGVGGLATALALQPTLSNLFSGIQILASRSIRPGDFIRLGSGEEGYVQDISWRIATIRTPLNNLVIVPNAKLADAVVTNYHAPDREMPLVIPITVAYGSDLELVERTTIEVAKDVLATIPGGVESYEPLIRYSGLGDSAIQLNAILRVKEWGDQGLVRHEFLRRILDAYKRDGIDIPFPQRVVHQAV